MLHTGPAHHVLCTVCRTRTRSYSSEVNEQVDPPAVFVFAVATDWGGIEEVGRSRSICVFVVAIVSVQDSRARRIITVRRPEMNAMFRTLYCTRRIYGMGDISTYIIIRSTAPYSAARETTTSVGLTHARPIICTSRFGALTHSW